MFFIEILLILIVFIGIFSFILLLVFQLKKLLPPSDKIENRQREEHNKPAFEIITSKEFSDFKYLEGYIVRDFINTFCMLSEKGNFFFYPHEVSFDINDVIAIDLKINGSVSNGFKGAIAGGLLLGGIGALAGYLATKSNSIYQLGLEFGLDNFDQPSFTFMFFDSPEKFSVNNHEVVAAKERLHRFMSHMLVIDKRYNKSSLFSNKIDLDGELN